MCDPFRPPWGRVKAVIQEFTCNFLANHHIGEDAGDELIGNYILGMYLAQLDHLLCYMTHDRRMSNRQIGKFFHVHHTTIKNWKEHSYVVDGKVFYWGLTHAELTFKHFEPLTPKQRHLEGVMTVLRCALSLWFHDVEDTDTRLSAGLGRRAVLPGGEWLLGTGIRTSKYGE